MQDAQGIKWLLGVELRPGVTLPLPTSQKPRVLLGSETLASWG